MGHQAVKHGVQALLLGVAQCDVIVLCHVPIGEELQLAAQQGLVIGGQHVGLGGLLPEHQGINSLQKQGLPLWQFSVGQHLHHGVRTQVVQQHEALRLLPGQHLWRQQASIGHQLGDGDRRLRIFFVGWRVHQDERAWSALHAKVAAKTCVRRCNPHRSGVQAVRRGDGQQPIGESLAAWRVRPAQGGNRGLGRQRRGRGGVGGAHG